MSATIEISHSVNRKTVEDAYRRAKLYQKQYNSNPRVRTICEQGMRAANHRDPKLLKALEQGIETLVQIQEEQLGRTQRDASRQRSERADQVPVGLWREAYKMADQGTPLEHFMYIYAVAGELAGVVTVMAY